MPQTLDPQKTKWSPLRLHSFRFFFIFFSLKIISSPNFWSYLIVRNDAAVWSFFDKYQRPFYLWLNNQVFHFYYIHAGWTGFTGPLKIIQGILYLLLALMGTIGWRYAARKSLSHDRLQYWFNQCVSIALALSAFSYGIIKLIPVQMSAPGWIKLNTRLGDLSPFDLIWSTLGYGTGYQMFAGALEVLAALCLIFRKTRIFGLLLLLPLLLNVIMLNYSFSIGVLHFSVFLLSLDVYLLLPYAGNLYRLFFCQQPVSLIIRAYPLITPWKKKGIQLICISLIGISFIPQTIRALRWQKDDRIAAKNNSIFGITHFVLNGDSIAPVLNDPIRWQFIMEGIKRSVPYLAIIPMDIRQTKYYTIVSQDSIKHCITIKSRENNDSSKLILHYQDCGYNNRHIETTLDGNKISADLLRIIPDSSLNLLKGKPDIWDH